MRADWKAWLAAAVLGAGAAVAGPAGAQDEVARRFSVPGHGGLQLGVPKGWRATSKSMDDPASVVLRMGPASGDGFNLQVTTLWLDAEKRAKQTQERLRAQVASGGGKLLEQSAEQRLAVEELRMAQGYGFYYSLTDKAPKAGEYKYLTQGMLVTGELMTIFTLLHHDAEISEKTQALKMFAGATHVAAAAAAAGKHFSFDMGEPRLRVVVPDLPPIEMGPHPNAGAQPHARFMGSAKPAYTVSVLMPTADPGMTAADCARSISRSLASRYGLKRDDVGMHQTSDSTYVMLFPVSVGPLTQLKAYLMSGYGGSHCVEVHISRLVSERARESELAGWYQGFREARIEAY